LKFLVSRLNPSCRAAMERAAASALDAGHAEVDTLHLIAQLSGANRTDAWKILDDCGIDRQRLTDDCRDAIGQLESSSVKMPMLSNSLVRVLSAAWNISSGELASESIRSGAIVLAVIDSGEAARLAQTVSAELKKLDAR